MANGTMENILVKFPVNPHGIEIRLREAVKLVKPRR